MQKFLIVAGVLLILTGILLPLLLRFGLGHLPGDIHLKRGNISFYFPITTCLVLSAIATILVALFRQ